VRTEETSGRKHSMEAWLAMAIPDPAFFLVGVDDGETSEEAKPPYRRAASGARRRVTSEED
jgi:hypothetical protein